MFYIVTNQKSDENETISSYVAIKLTHVIVIPQFEYNILVITQVQGKAKDVSDN